MKNSSISGFSHEVTKVLPVIMRHMIEKDGSAINKIGLTMVQMVAVHLLDDSGPLKMNEIAKALHISLPGATGLIDRLYKLKMVKREFDETDRRIIRISLSLKGKKTVDMTKEMRRRNIEDIFGKLTEKERKTYLEILNKIKNVIIKG